MHPTMDEHATYDMRWQFLRLNRRYVSRWRTHSELVAHLRRNRCPDVRTHRQLFEREMLQRFGITVPVNPETRTLPRGIEIVGSTDWAILPGTIRDHFPGAVPEMRDSPDHIPTLQTQQGHRVFDEMKNRKDRKNEYQPIAVEVVINLQANAQDLQDAFAEIVKEAADVQNRFARRRLPYPSVQRATLREYLNVFRLRRAKRASEFSADEFGGKMSPEGLRDEIRGDLPDCDFPEAEDAQQWLAELIRRDDWYARLRRRHWGQLDEMDRRTLRLQEAKCGRRQPPEEKRKSLRRRNRLLLELAYPARCPKGERKEPAPDDIMSFAEIAKVVYRREVRDPNHPDHDYHVAQKAEVARKAYEKACRLVYHEYGFLTIRRKPPENLPPK